MQVKENRGCGVFVVAVMVAVVCGVVLAGCVPLDPARLAFGCEVVNETLKTHTVPLQDAHLQYGRIDPDPVRTGAPGRHDAGKDIGADQGEPVEHTSNAPCDCPDPSLVCAKSGYFP